MTLLFYIDCMRLGGAQRVMNNLLSHYVSLGHDVILVNDNPPSREYREYKIEDNVKRLYLSQDSVIAGNLIRVLRLRKIIRQEKPQVVISFLGPPNYRMLLATMGVKCRKIVSVRNDPYKEYGTGIKKMLSNIIFCLADGTVFQTNEAANYFNRLVRKKSKVIYNPVAEEFYRHHWKGKKGDVVCIGRLQSQKNPMLLIKAFSLIAEKYPDIVVRYYGEGDLKEELQNYVKNNNLSDRILFEGQSTCVPVVLENAEVYVLSSDYEGMPNALMEAMTVGVPVISTDCPCGGPKELICDDSQGILVPCNDEQKLAEALDLVLSDDELRIKLFKGETERSHAFENKIVLKQWNEILLRDKS